MSTIADDLACALDPVVFARRLGVDPDAWQADLLRSNEPNIIVAVSRQAGKSTTTSIKALWVAHFQPGATILLLSPSMRQSGELFKKVKTFEGLLDSDDALETESATELGLRNGSRIVSLPGSPTTVRGYSAPALVVVDEAAHVEGDDLFVAVRPMLAVSGGQLILLSTPNGKTGYFHDAFHYGTAYHRILVTAEECPRISAAFLAREREAMTSAKYRQEYECSFEAMAHALFDPDTVAAAISEDVPLWYPELVRPREEAEPCFESLE